MKKLFKYLLHLMLFTILSIFIYFFTAYLFTLFPKKVNTQEKKEKTIYILYSTIHADIVLNINDINRSFLSKFKIKKYGYLAFGWGDKETYLTTPQTNDFKLTTSLKALFLNTPSLMHVSYIDNILKYESLKEIKISTAQEAYLNHSILETFARNKKPIRGYGREDFFYEAKGKYNLINTCNTWAGDKLREANITMPYWTPISWSIISN